MVTFVMDGRRGNERTVGELYGDKEGEVLHNNMWLCAAIAKINRGVIALLVVFWRVGLSFFPFKQYYFQLLLDFPVDKRYRAAVQLDVERHNLRMDSTRIESARANDKFTSVSRHKPQIIHRLLFFILPLS